MPMSLHRDASGELTVSFPVCRGERVQSVGVGAHAGGDYVVMRYGPAPEQNASATVESFVVDDETIASDRLDVPWPVSETWPVGTASGVDDVDSVWASTTTRSAGVDLEMLLPAGPGDWLVIGDRIEHDAAPVAVSATEAKAAVDAFCEGS
ncbi:hypothetical protein LGT39_03080 [Demequina sp. TTPB684]|uniref:hypothetical protein n=1 Tax=unclassified Demequina TaxID=2620311 RepID=UPI001CF2677A|nr:MULTISPECIES: hypothetical protein [unclassified Demequina]MCB2411833.1 hypothetical protein [Demequina sp. TTPB684]UPU87268.1 hypothetical protein LGT36_008260 [Demequina sp. TMPB413]